MIDAIIEELLFIGFKTQVAKEIALKHLTKVKEDLRGEKITVVKIVDGLVKAEREVRNFSEDDDFPEEDLQ